MDRNADVRGLQLEHLDRRVRELENKQFEADRRLYELEKKQKAADELKEGGKSLLDAEEMPGPPFGVKWL